MSPGRPAEAGRPGLSLRPADYSVPVLSTVCSWVFALFTVVVKLAPCMSAFIMFGMMLYFPVSAVAQFLELSGEIWV